MSFNIHSAAFPLDGDAALHIRAEAGIAERDGAFVETFGIIRARRQVQPNGHFALPRVVQVWLQRLEFLRNDGCSRHVIAGGLLGEGL